MILNTFNKIFALLSGIAFAVVYFLTVSIQTSAEIVKGIAFALVAMAAGWICVFIIIWLFFMITALTINTKKEYTKINKVYYWIFNLWYAYVISLFRMKVIVSGTELIPTDQRFLAICNHRSNLDNMVQSVVLKKTEIAYISKKENFQIPFACQFMKRAMYLSIDRGDLKNGLQTITKAADYILQDKVSIGVFPEGRRSKNGELLKFKPGCLKVAEKALCPIVVCCIDGTEKVHKHFPFRKTTVHFDILKVYTKQDVESRNTVDLSEEMRNLILQKLGK